MTWKYRLVGIVATTFLVLQLAVIGYTATQYVGQAIQPVSQSGTWTVQPGNTANTTAWLVTGAGGLFPSTQSGTWTVQPGNTANTTPWLVTSPAVAAPTIAKVGATTTSAQLIAANATRKGIEIDTDCANTDAVAINFGASAAVYASHKQMPACSRWQPPDGLVVTSLGAGSLATSISGSFVVE